MYKFCIDHILELRIPCKILAQDVSRRLKAFVMHFESRIRMSTKQWFRFKGLLLDPDWLVAATVLSRRLCLFGWLTLGISQCSPEALPDPILPDAEVFDLSVHDCGRWNFWMKIPSRQIWLKVACVVELQSIHEKCSQSRVPKPRNFLQRFRIRSSHVLIRHSKLSLLVRTSHALLLRHGRDWRLKNIDQKLPGARSKMEVWQPTSKPKLFVAGLPEQRNHVDGGWYVQEPRCVARVSLQEGLYLAVSSTISALHFLRVLDALDQLNTDQYGINWWSESLAMDLQSGPR